MSVTIILSRDTQPKSSTVSVKVMLAGLLLAGSVYIRIALRPKINNRPKAAASPMTASCPFGHALTRLRFPASPEFHVLPSSRFDHQIVCRFPLASSSAAHARPYAAMMTLGLDVHGCPTIDSTAKVVSFNTVKCCPPCAIKIFSLSDANCQFSLSVVPAVAVRTATKLESVESKMLLAVPAAFVIETVDPAPNAPLTNFKFPPTNAQDPPMMSEFISVIKVV